MATRFTAKSGGEKGTTYTVEIDDSTGGSNTDIEIQGFTLTYDPDEQEDPISPIISSSCTFVINVKESYQSTINTFISDLVGADEGRFRVKITDGSSNIYWLGYILTDQITYQDQDWADAKAGSEFLIRAVDGISRLKDLDYNDAGTAYQGRVTFKEHLFNILDKIGLSDFYGGTDNYLFTICRWYEDDMGGLTLNDNSFDNTYVDHAAFISKDSDGNNTYQDCYTVLKQIAQTFLCRFYVSNGVYRLDQIPEYRESSVYRHRYYSDGTKPGTTSGVDLSVVENSDDVIRLAGGRYSYFAPVRRICYTFKHFNDKNYLAGAFWDENSDPRQLTDTFGRDGIRLRIRLAWEVIADFSLGVDDPWISSYMLYDLEVRITIGLTNYYLKRTYNFNQNNNIQFSEPEWTTTSTDRYKVAIPVSSEDDTQYYTLTFETPEMPGTGDFAGAALDVDYDTIVNNNTSVSITTASFLAHKTLLQLVSDDDNALAIETKYTLDNDTAPNASLVLEYETLMNDSPEFFTSAGLTIENGSAEEEPSGSWTKGTSGLGARLYYLWLNEVMKIREESLLRWTGEIYGADYAFHNLIEFTTGQLFVGQRVEYDSKAETWRGDWWFVGYDDTLSATQGPVIVVPPITGGTGNILTSEPSEPIVNNPPPSGGGEPFGIGNVITNTDGNILTSGGAITSINIDAPGVDNIIKNGDTFYVYDPVTQHLVTFNATADVSASDTSISISSTTPPNDLSDNSYVIVPPEVYIPNVQSQARRVRYKQKFTGSSSATLTVTENSGNLPTDTDQIEVYMGTGRLHETDDYTVSGSDITLTWTPDGNANFWVYFSYP